MSIIFGPINSRRFKKSLGIDLSPFNKQCNFDCLYCELKRAKKVNSFDKIVELKEVIKELKEALKKYNDIDFITITANGEPTLYPYLNELIEKINQFKQDKKVLILSNGSTINKKEVQETLLKFDVVKLSLDCATKRCFKKLDRAIKKIDLEDIKKGMLDFRKKFKNRLQIEILFVKGINDNNKEIKELNNFLLHLKPDVVDLSTISRPPAYNVKPLNLNELFDIKLKFDKSLNINIATSNKDSNKKNYYSKNEILEILKRRPLSKEDIKILFNKEAQNNLGKLLEANTIVLKDNFYILKDNYE